MKKVLALVACVLATVSHAQTTNLIPELKIGDNAKLKVWGWAQGSYVEDRLPRETDLSMLVLRQRLTVGNHWEAFLDLDLAQVDNDHGNWLREINASYYLDPDDGEADPQSWKLTVGRIFVAAGNVTPPPFLIETVNYPQSDHFSAYAWGLQVSGKWDGWNLSADVTGASGLTFDAPEALNFDRPEASLRLEKLSETWSLAGSLQLSTDFQRYSIDGSFTPNKQVTLRGALYYERLTDDTASNHFGGYGLVAYRPAKWLELHGMLDHSQALPKTWVETTSGFTDSGEYYYERTKKTSSNETHTTLTPGLRFFFGDNVTLTADCVIPVDGEDPLAKTSVGARLQVRF